MTTTGSPPFLLRETGDGDDHDAAVALLEEAGWSRPLLDEWAAAGTVLELYDPADDVPRGAAIVTSSEEGTFELRAWSATVDTGGPAVSDRLVRAISDALRRTGGRRVVASVGDANGERLTMLLDAGFRFVSIERDVPPSAHGRPSDRSRDLVWMDQDL